jgi:hypothetical protein
MIAPATARAALDHLWCAMVELAESGNAAVIAHQRKPNLKGTRRIAAAAADLALLSQAAAALARHSEERSR